MAGCAVKFFDGGWFPIAMGLALFTIMTTWAQGRVLLLSNIRSEGIDLKRFIDGLSDDSVHRVKRTAVYAVSSTDTVPHALLRNLRHNQVLHQRNVVLTVVFHEVPWVAMTRNATSVASFFHLPDNSVVELGSRAHI